MEEKVTLKKPSSIEEMDQDGGDEKKEEDKVPVRTYLDNTVVPVLLSAMSELVKERPEDPIKFVANFLLKNNPKNSESASA